MVKTIRYILVCLMWFFFGAVGWAAVTCTVSSPCSTIANFNTDIADAVAGETMYLQSGNYTTSTIIDVNSRDGSVGSYITLACSNGSAEDLGGCVIKDNTNENLRIRLLDSSYIKVRGFKFENINITSSITGVIEVNGTNNVIIEENLFLECGGGGSSVTVSLYDTNGNDTYNVEITKNTFDKNQSSTRYGSAIELALKQPIFPGPMTGVHIHKNAFLDHPSSNYGEAIQLGRGATSTLIKPGAIVEENYFYKWDGDAEVISNKSSGNIIRHNIVHNTKASIKFRTSDQSTLEGNIWKIDDIEDNSAYWACFHIHGRGHKIINNYCYRGTHGILLKNADETTCTSTRSTLTSAPSSNVITDSTASFTSSYIGNWVWFVDGNEDYISPRAYHISAVTSTTLTLYDDVDDTIVADPATDGVQNGDAYYVTCGEQEVSNTVIANNTIINTWRTGIGNERSDVSTGNTMQNNLSYNDEETNDLYGMHQDFKTGTDTADTTYLKNIAYTTLSNRPEWLSADSDPEPTGIHKESECGAGEDESCDPNLTSATWTQIPQSSGAADGYGSTHSDVGGVDMFGNTRNDPPTIGAFEVGGDSNPGSVSVGCSFTGCGSYTVFSQVALANRIGVSTSGVQR